jgi:hypothetical protein
MKTCVNSKGLFILNRQILSMLAVANWKRLNKYLMTCNNNKKEMSMFIFGLPCVTMTGNLNKKKNLLDPDHIETPSSNSFSLSLLDLFVSKCKKTEGQTCPVCSAQRLQGQLKSLWLVYCNPVSNGIFRILAWASLLWSLSTPSNR